MYLPFNTSASWTKKTHSTCGLLLLRLIQTACVKYSSSTTCLATSTGRPFQGERKSSWQCLTLPGALLLLGKRSAWTRALAFAWGPSCGCPISDIDTVDTLIPNRYLIPTTKFDEQIISDVNTVPSQKPD